MITRVQHEVNCSYCDKFCVNDGICCANQEKLRAIDNIINKIVDDINDYYGDKHASTL